MSEFDRALKTVLVTEGGYVNHPKDPGGPTNKGVTQAVYDAYRKGKGLVTQTVRAITDAEIAAIYKLRYWDLFKGDEIADGVAYVVFDGAVNSGVGQSVKWLQRALAPYYKGAVDGLIGPGTLTAIEEHPNHDALIARICALRLAFMRALKTWSTFGRGWTWRVAAVLKTGQAWATGAEAAPMRFVDGAQAKAFLSDAKTGPAKAPGDLAAGGGSAGAAITQAINQLSPLTTTPTIASVVMWLTVAGVVVAAGGYAYRTWAKYRQDRIAEAIGT
jgi:lysozyme family protein